MKRIAFVLLLALSLQSSWPSSLSAAVQPGEILTNPTLETRARALSQQLRCMVCQNESIDESDAPLARDLRILVREYETFRRDRASHCDRKGDKPDHESELFHEQILRQRR